MQNRATPLRFILFILVLILVEYYAVVSLRISTRELQPTYKYLIQGLYILCAITWLVVFFTFSSLRGSDVARPLMNFGLVFFMAFFFLKVMMASFMLIDDIRRLFFWVSSFFYESGDLPLSVENGMTRSAFLRRVGLVLGGTLFGTFFYGMMNRHKYAVKKVAIDFPNLPTSFHGLKVVQISDIHSGSFTNKAGVQRGIDMINNLKPDLVLFTGDLVNSKSSEMLGYINIFKQISASIGVYSIFGNHDYGDYYQWKTEEDKAANLEELKQIHKALGWHLLLDENINIKKGEDFINIIGVENISSSFRSYGSLPKAYQGAENAPFKILMSHDPIHWDKEVVTEFKEIDLTLSGHTHGFQFGIEIPGFKWSPASFIYKQWAGLYKKENQYIYVNRGFGFLGYPGRIGILPEITLLELNSTQV
jgi:predicted MPP superfamily phosphohydrolase